MNDKYRPVSVSGMYWTGSSAVVDLLSEHQRCNIIPDEFSFFSFGQFFEDLEASLEHSDILNKEQRENLIRMRYFNDTETKYLYSAARYVCRRAGLFPKSLFYRRAGMAARLGKEYDQKCNDLFSCFETAKYSGKELNPKQVRSIVNDILYLAGTRVAASSSGAGRSGMVDIFDQLVAPAYISAAAKSIPNLRVISVDRDWRDQWVELRAFLGIMLKVHCAIDLRPCGENHAMQSLRPIDYFIELRKLSRNLRAKQESAPNQDVLWVDFEDVVAHTSDVMGEICSFLGLDYTAWEPNGAFIGEHSAKNIGLWKKCGIESELAYIDERLTDK